MLKNNSRQPITDKKDTAADKESKVGAAPTREASAKADKKATVKQKKQKKNVIKEKPQKPQKDAAKEKSVKEKSKKEKEQKKPKTEKKKGGFKYLTGLLFAKMMRGGAKELRAHADTVNKLNVFPVPDGDTGDNMSMTIESGVAALEKIDSDNLASVMKVASKGMLLGARGNSGVILSQFFAGIAKNLEEADEADPVSMGEALKAGVDRAYASVMTPMEGTILTVARESVEYAISKINEKSTIRSLFGDLVKEMNAAVERTPETLAVLKEAGVVDSGGQGLFYIIDGLNRVLNGEEISAPESVADSVPTPAAVIQDGNFGPDSDMIYGYCTELLVQLMRKKCDPDSFDIESLKDFLSSVGDSVVAFKTDSVVKLHVHTKTPDRVISHLLKFGEFISVKIENMSLQHSELSADNQVEAAPAEVNEAQAAKESEREPEIVTEHKKYAVVAVACGLGIQSVFAELGADMLVDGGQTNNPSTSDFIDAFGNIDAEHIFVLPNNSNIVMAAKQAAEIYTEAKVHVIEAKTVGAGYVALTAFNPEAESPEEIVREMTDAISSVTSAYISPSIRDAEIDGVSIKNGDTIGVIEKEIVVSDPSESAAFRTLVDKLLSGGDKFLLTVFCGIDATGTSRAEAEAYVVSNYPDVECYFMDGGQEVYPYLFVAE